MNSPALIIGHGYAKAWCGTRSAVLPAVAAPASISEFQTSISNGPQPIDLGDDGRWLVGDDALLYAPNRLVSILDRSRYSHPSFRALARAALERVLDPPTPWQTSTTSLMSAMPGAWYGDLAARSTLETALRAAAAPWQIHTISVVPEAASVYYAYVFEGGALDPQRIRGSVGVIDAGYRDINVAWFDGGRYVAGESVPGGMVAALRSIQKRITACYGLELALHQVDLAVQQGSITVAGQRQPLPDGSTTDLAAGANTVLATARSQWPNGGRAFDAVVLGGGGAVSLFPALQSTFAHQLTMPFTNHDQTSQPQLIGVRGLAAIARAQQMQQRQAVA